MVPGRGAGDEVRNSNGFESLGGIIGYVNVDLCGEFGVMTLGVDFRKAARRTFVWRNVNALSASKAKLCVIGYVFDLTRSVRMDGMTCNLVTHQHHPHDPWQPF